MTHKDTQPVMIPVAVSARHVHLTQATIDRLFGANHTLRVHSPLSQPSQYAAQETVELVGPKGRLHGVRVIGPARSENQVELARTDEIALGLDAPLRVSGDLAGSPGLRMVGPRGEIELTEGAILARRHIHMTPADAACLGLRDGEVVEVGIEHSGRALIFGDVVVRVAPDYRMELHLDTDEANAAGLHGGEDSLLRTTRALARLHGRPAG